MPAHVLLIRCGPGNGTEMAPEGTLASMACSLYEAAELTASCPVSDDETARVFEVVTNWNPELLLLLLSGGAVVQEGANFFELVRRNRWRVPVVVVCPPVKPHDRIELLRLGASEVLSMPLQLQEVIPRLLTVHRRADQDKSSVAQLRAALGLEHVIGESPAFVALIKQIPPIAKYDVSVLILGETGTGKEVFARAIHYAARGRPNPSFRLTAAPSRSTCSKTSSSGMNPARSPAPIVRAVGSLKKPTEARSSWMKWTVCRPRPR